MYNEQLEKLIEMALMDGELTDKEKEILLKKANEFGIDLDEFEMVLEARLSEKKLKLQPSAKKTGNLFKCPACFEIIPPLTRVCPSCQHIIEGQEKNSELENLIDEMEDSIKNMKSLPKETIFYYSINNIFIVLLILGIYLMFLGNRLDNDLAFLGLVIFGVGIFLFFRKKKSDKDKNIKFTTINENYNKIKRKANTLYSEVKRIRILISEIEARVEEIKAERKKLFNNNLIGVLVFSIILIGVYFLTPNNLEARINQQEKEKVQKNYIEKNIDSFSKNDFLLEVEKLTDNGNKVYLKSKMQLKEMEIKFNEVKKQIDLKKFENASILLSNIAWKQESNNYSEFYEHEMQTYNQFSNRFKYLNELLPENKKIPIPKELY